MISNVKLQHGINLCVCFFCIVLYFWSNYIGTWWYTVNSNKCMLKRHVVMRLKSQPLKCFLLLGEILNWYHSLLWQIAVWNWKKLSFWGSVRSSGNLGSRLKGCGFESHLVHNTKWKWCHSHAKFGSCNQICSN